jgi:CDP-glycerol glycerophosphotransferase (TagB/SpsB family)
MCRSELLHAIAKGNYELIIRPHPHSWLVEASFFEQIATDLARYSNVSIDRAIDASESLSRADLLISGRSAIRFDFAFIYEKPVLSVRLPLDDADEYEFNDLGEIWEDQAQYLLGTVIEPQTDTEDIIGKIEEALRFKPSEIDTLRQTTVANIGESSERIVNWCLSQVREV